MSSPLSWFRKNQKLLLGFFGVMLMIAFTVSLGTGVDPIVDYLSGGSVGNPTKNEVVVSWDGGQLYQSDLDALRTNRAHLAAFMQATASHAAAKGGKSTVPEIGLALSDEALVEFYLLKQRGEEMGLVVSDDTVLEYLLGFAGGVVNRGELATILSQSTRGQLKQGPLFEIVRDELVAQMVRMMAISGLYPTSPVDAWDFFNRLNRKVKAELMPIKVSEFIDQVETPSDKELESLFDKYKNTYPNPYSPEPGFKQRRKIAFQFVRADFNKFRDAELPKVTEVEIKNYYEQHKDDYRLTQPDAGGSGDSSPAAPGASSPETAPQPSDLELESTSTDSSGRPESVPETGPTDSNPQGAESPQTETESGQGPASAEEGAEEETGDLSLYSVDSDSADSPEEAAEAAVDDADSTEDTGDSGVTSPVTAPGVETDGDNSKGDSGTAAPESSIGESDLFLGPKPESSTSEEPSDATEAPSANAAEETAQAGPAIEPTDAVTPSGTTPTYRPLEEVAEDIRKEIASERARKARDTALAEARREVDRYAQELVTWKFKIQLKADTPEPTPPNLTPIVDQYEGLSYGETGLVDRFSVEEYEIGQAREFRFTRAGGLTQVPFADYAFGQDTEPFKAREFPRGFEEIRFLFWKVEEKKALVPKLADVKAEVVRAWKMQEDKAVRLAREAAERDAQKARDSGKPLAEVFADAPGRLPPIEMAQPVTWMSSSETIPMGTPGTAPSLTRIPGVDGAGEAFREKMFRMRPGEIGVAVNQMHTLVYVIRIVSELPDEQTLRDQFLKSGVTYPVQYLASLEIRSDLRQWYQGMLEQLHLQWSRDPEDAPQFE